MTQSRNLWREVSYSNALPLSEGTMGIDVMSERGIFFSILKPLRKKKPCQSALHLFKCSMLDGNL